MLGAPDYAEPAMRILFSILFVLLPVLAQVDGHRQVHVRCQGTSALTGQRGRSHEPSLAQFIILRNGVRRQHQAHAGLIGIHRAVAIVGLQRGGPAREDVAIRRNNQAGVDQRRAAQATGTEHVHIVTHSVVEQAQRFGLAAELAQHTTQGIGKVSGQPLLAALQDGETPTGRQTRCTDGSAIARAHDDHVIAVLQL